jgi:hypothetical protein
MSKTFDNIKISKETKEKVDKLFKEIEKRDKELESKSKEIIFALDKFGRNLDESYGLPTYSLTGEMIEIVQNILKDEETN